MAYLEGLGPIRGVLHFLGTKRMLYQGLKVKKLNNFSNFKSVVSKLCRISLLVIKRHPE